MITYQVLVSRLVGRTDPSGRKWWSLETRPCLQKASIAPTVFPGRSALEQLCRSQERPILAIFCRPGRISRERGPRPILRKSRIVLLGLIVATSAFLRIVCTLCLLFASTLIHRTSKHLSPLRETHTASNLGEILDALGDQKASPVPPQASKEFQASP